jgi:6-phosphogluconolactonase
MRKSGLALLLLVILAASAAHAESGSDHYRVYIGTYTSGASEGIYLMDFDAESGRLEMRGLAAETENPSFLAPHPTLPVLYATGTMGPNSAHPGGTVSAFRIDRETGLLSLLNHESSRGDGPCHVTVSPSGRHAAVANYSGGSVALLPLGDDGRLLPATDFAQHEGSSVHPARQQRPFAHSVNFDAAGRYLFAADLGADRVFVYRYEPDTGAIPPNDPPAVALAPGAGPRHFTFHPSGRYAYAVNELDNTVTAFEYEAEKGKLTVLHSADTLPPDFEGENTTAEVRVHPSGRFLYASNRGHDSIAVFAIDPDTGKLRAAGHTPTGGRTPRNFNLDPSGRFLLAANQQTDNVVVFRIDDTDGSLALTGQSVDVPTPVCVLFLAP